VVVRHTSRRHEDGHEGRHREHTEGRRAVEQGDSSGPGPGGTDSGGGDHSGHSGSDSHSGSDD
jgi:hypothetical protein